MNNTISIHGKIFVLNKYSFEEIMGVYNVGEEIFLERQDESELFVRAFLGSNKRLVISQLCTDLDQDKDGRLVVCSKICFSCDWNDFGPPMCSIFKVVLCEFAEQRGRYKE